ncbi:MAG TPA: AMP-binding protein [Bacteroidales bacterium]|nr:AMP-binding protein [Bacteroidales bacterium]
MIDHRNINGITFQGKYREGEALRDYCTEELSMKQTEPWRRSIFSFLMQWLDDKSHIIVPSSGSSGQPKQLQLSKQHMVNSALKTGAFLDLKKGDSALLCLSADYIAGKMMLVRAMTLELNLFITEPADNPLQNIPDARFDFAAMVPLQVHELLKTKAGEAKLNNIRNLIIGGSDIGFALRNKIKTLTNRTFHTYGMTETVSHIAMQQLNGQIPDEVFHLLPGVNISTDSHQRLIIDAPDVASVPVHTNDVAELLTPDTFRILGRYDQMIISGGINLFPEVLEAKIETFIPKRFAISCVADERLGEKVVLVIEDEKWEVENTRILKANISKALERFAIPKEIIFINKIPETPNQKIDRIALRKAVEVSV